MPATPTSLSQQLALLDKKRRVLHGLCQLVIALEHLHASLEAALLLGGTPQQLSSRERQALAQIRQRVASLSQGELLNAIGQLDERVYGELQELCQLALQLVDDPHSRLEQLESLNPRANSFNRNARTSIALRHLLAERGEMLAPLALPLPRQDIEARLQQVDAHEQAIRQQVSEHVRDMRADIALLLDHPDCSEPQRAMFNAMDRALADNLAHIAAGLSLSDLPMPIDNIEVRGGSASASVPARSSPACSAPILQAPDGATAPQPGAETPPTRSDGLLPRIRQWLNSPWDSSWKIGGRPRD